MESDEDSRNERRNDRAYDDVAAMPMAQPSDRMGGEVISLDGMRGPMVANFEQDDLDVPAFLRKRNEVM